MAAVGRIHRCAAEQMQINPNWLCASTRRVGAQQVGKGEGHKNRQAGKGGVPPRRGGPSSTRDLRPSSPVPARQVRPSCPHARYRHPATLRQAGQPRWLWEARVRPAGVLKLNFFLVLGRGRAWPGVTKPGKTRQRRCTYTRAHTVILLALFLARADYRDIISLLISH